MKRLDSLLLYVVLAGTAAAVCGCDQDKPAHAGPAPATAQPPAEGLGFCAENAPAPSASASSCTCEAPSATAKAAADAAPAADHGGVIPPDSRQALVVTTPDWQSFKGKAQRFRRDDAGTWHAEDKPLPVAIGRRGMAWGRGLHPQGQPGPSKREGDNKSPAGVFELAGAYGYADAPPPGSTWPYRRLTVGWKCIDDPRQDAYNTLIVPEGAPLDTPAAPWDGVRRDVVFDMFVEVRQNVSPTVASAGSCVLLHPWINEQTPTQGCTSFRKSGLQTVLAWLSPKEHPVLIQLPESEWKRLAPGWALPH